jgi:hypothetical protein
LGRAIDWPKCLNFPPSEVLPLILSELVQVRLGYGIYLVHSLAWATIGAAVAWVALGSNTRTGTVFWLISVSIVIIRTMACQNGSVGLV